jgi:acetyltransferase-like isoleucine patch superfamily enzyme
MKLTPEKQQLFDADCATWDAWFAGDRSAPIKLMHQEPEYCFCNVVFRSLGDWLGWYWRNTMVAFAHYAIFSDWKIFFYRRAGIKIGKGVYIAPQVMIDPFMPGMIELEDDAFLGIGCHLLAHDYTSTFMRFARVTVRKGAVIGAFSTIRCGVVIGEKATVGAHSFVCKDVAPGTTVGGVPAKELGKGDRV